MNAPLPAEGKVLSSYGEVTRTFTYGILATLPLFVVYHARITFLPGYEGRIRNMADGWFQDASALFGVLPPMISGFVLFAGLAAMLYYERQKYGFIQTRPFFFLLTLNEAILFGLLLAPTTYWLAQLMISFSPYERVVPTIVRDPLDVFGIVHAFGAGFYEELLFRVILLGGGLAILRFLKVPGMPARIVIVAVVSMLFSVFHYIGPLGEHFFIDSFLYRSYAGVFLSAVYLHRGFAVAAWSHAVLNIVIHL
jgi:hypothetical protein